jgi:phosphoglycolate phosphatase-like HAD superfamily hydrolase
MQTPRRPQLLLFDCDGTLFSGQDELAPSCMVDAIAELTGAELRNDLFDDPGCNARTARRFARETAVRLGCRDFDPDAWIQRVLELYIDRFSEETARAWRLADQAEATLRRLTVDGLQLVLVTGGLEALARFRLERLGIGRYFPDGTGAFGCEAEQREDLLRLALSRSACLPQNAVQIGRTSRALSTAHEMGLRSIAVGVAGVDADVRIGSLVELPHALRELRAAA